RIRSARSAIKRRLGTTRTNNFIAQHEIAEEPIKAKGASIVLSDFNELALNIDLRRRNVKDLHCCLDHVQIVQRGPKHQAPLAIVEKDALRRIEIDTHREEELAHGRLGEGHVIGASHRLKALPALTTTATKTAAACRAAGDANPRNCHQTAT